MHLKEKTLLPFLNLFFCSAFGKLLVVTLKIYPTADRVRPLRRGDLPGALRVQHQLRLLRGLRVRGLHGAAVALERPLAVRGGGGRGGAPARAQGRPHRTRRPRQVRRHLGRAGAGALRLGGRANTRAHHVRGSAEVNDLVNGF